MADRTFPLVVTMNRCASPDTMEWSLKAGDDVIAVVWLPFPDYDTVDLVMPVLLRKVIHDPL